MLMAFLQRIVNGGGSISGYLDRLGLDEGFLILFDRGDRPWSEKIYESRAAGPKGQQIHILGA